jgi:uncharacterized protein (DUF342 family)
LGEELPARDGLDLSISLGKNVVVSDDGMRIYATDDGEVSWSGNFVSVEKVQRIPGDVNYDIDFKGMVVVEGCVSDGCTIRATGDIEVKGGVGDSSIEAGGIVRIKGGVEGKGHAYIRSNLDVVVGYVKNTVVNVRGNAIINEAIIGSKVVAGERVLCTGKRGFIVGSSVHAGAGIDAKVVGSEEEVSTELRVGTMPGTKNQLSTCMKTEKDLVRQIEGLKERISSLVSEEEEMGFLTPEEEGALRGAKELMQEKERELGVIRARINSLMKEKEKGKKGTISVCDTLFPGVDIYIGGVGLHISKRYNSISLKAEGNRIIATPYKCLSSFKPSSILPEKDKVSASAPPHSVVVEAPTREEGLKIGARLLGMDPSGVSSIDLGSDTEGAKYLLKLKVFPKREEEYFREIQKRETQEEARYSKEEAERFEAQLETLEESLRKLDWRHDPKLDGTLEIRIEDDIRVYVLITPPKIGGRRIVVDDVIEGLEQKGIRDVSRRVIQEIIRKRRYSVPILVKEGVLPTKGIDGRLIYKYGGGEDDRKWVLPGQLLAARTRAEYGKDGRDVFGNPLPALKGEDVVVIAGRNCFLSKDGLRVFSAKRGQVFWDGEIVCVEDVRVVESDVEEGINFDGKIFIEGDVKTGAYIKATGDIKVSGDVYEAILVSDSNVIVEGGIMGKKNGKVFAGCDIKADFIEGGEIRAGGSVIVAHSIIRSKVQADRKVIARGDKGIIAGGTIEAMEVDGVTIGSFAGTLTLIHAKKKVSAKDSLYHGVKICMAGKEIPIMRMRRDVSFVNEGGKVKEKYYEESKIVKSIASQSSVSKIETSLPLSVVLTTSPHEGRLEASRLLGIDESRLDFEVLSGNGEEIEVRYFLKG